MAKLEYTFKNDTLFKMLFVTHPDLLKRLVAELLTIEFESIGLFEIKNPEMPPDAMGDKFCRLDINMTVDDQRVDLEIQVANEGDYPERSLFYWAREYSTALEAGGRYADLPRTIVISIVDFKLFDCGDFHSEFRPLEVSRHTLLTDKMVLHYFELPKLPEAVEADNALGLWLALFNASTEEELQQIEVLEVPIMNETIGVYRRITITDEFRELERLRALARHNEASALDHARREERAKWQEAMKEKDAVLAEQDAALAERDAVLAEKNTALAEQDRLIAELRAQLAENTSGQSES